MSEVIKVKPWGKDQGEYVLINAEDFDAAVHVKFDAQEVERKKPGRPAKEQE